MATLTVTVKLDNVPNRKVVLSTMFVAGHVADQVLSHARRNRKDIGRPAKAGFFLASSVLGSIAETGEDNLRGDLTANEKKVMDATLGLITAGGGIAQIIDGVRGGSNRNIAFGAASLASGSAMMGGVLGRIASERGNDGSVTHIKITPEELKSKFYELRDAIQGRAKELMNLRR